MALWELWELWELCLLLQGLAQELRPRWNLLFYLRSQWLLR